MQNIFTNDIAANSFMGLITDKEKSNHGANEGRKVFVNVAGRDVLRNLAIATFVIILGLTAGSISQQKMAFAQFDTLTVETAVKPA